eukprot:CAMPEP_0177646454 /NCGR_PEP_ID=MMETSP0447-20121125/9782_1 /TAXON_ID=0 /ORGANISM="Stygamoeba regulata, Strain BSH-02190019" /LENGTH=181 /DNA_ID=CAMNT_0019148987 /DNA_START=147 /DNA_END=692 /DNA_ORIENTATION=+
MSKTDVAAEQAKIQKFYPADDIKVPLKNRNKNKTARLRASITPGTVLIMLAGRFRGKRVVFLKQLPSGLLLVTGPYKVNGVPLRRVDQAYVIATSTKVNVAGADVSAVTDASFKADAATSEGKDFVKGATKTEGLTAERKALQKSIDTVIIGEIQKVPHLRDYLHAKFSLQKGQRPHAMKF